MVKSPSIELFELDVLEDFNPHQIDWTKLLGIEGSEKVNAYVEDLSTPDAGRIKY